MSETQRPTTEDDLRWAVKTLASVDGLLMDPAHLVADVRALATAFPEAATFQVAVLETEKAVRDVRDARVDTTPLLWDLEGLQSYHYRHDRRLREKPDLRIVFRRCEGVCDALIIGHRWVPENVY